MTTARAGCYAAVAALVTTLLLPAARAQTTTAVAEEPTVVRRTTLLVHDIDASIAFYRDLLGFTLWYESSGTRSAQSLPYDEPVGAASRFVIMKGRDPWIGMVGLLQYGEPRQPPAPPERLEPGDVVLMLETRDLDGIYRRMRDAGTPIFREPATTEVTGADGTHWTATFLFAFDPDGHLLEINERRD